MKKERLPMSDQEKRYLRFPLYRRIEHWVMVTAFITLGLTGLIQKYNETAFSRFVFEVLGGVEPTRIIHRVAAIALALVTIAHLGDFLYNWYVRRARLSMLPDKDDAVNAWKLFLHNLGFEKEAPKQGFYTFEEKFEYWALIWGTVLMGVTGFILWNPILANKILPASWIPAAKAAHGLEAVLAVLAVAVWHSYHVLIKHFNTSMYTGYMSQEEMEHYHPKALEEPPIELPAPDDPEFKRRKKVFGVVYSVVAAVMLSGLVFLVFTEDTALATRPPVEEIENIEAYAPLEAAPLPTTGSPVEAANLGTSWDDGIGDFFDAECGLCHSYGVQASGLDLSSYQAVLEGGKSGPAIRPGAGGISPVVLWPQRADHPVLLEDEVLAALREWIDAGAPEN
jgi:formate dehydrogenase gamma subunit